MKDKKRDIRKEKLAKLFYEMGMEEELVKQIVGINIKETKILNNSKEKDNISRMEKTY